MMMIQPKSNPWRKSTYSGGSENCVEVATGDVVGIRDTKDRDGGQLAVTGTLWTAFITTVKTEQ
jgi:hypothetical protein